VSSDLFIPQESSALRSNQQEFFQLIVLQHTFSSLAKYVAIFFIFWQAAVRRACSLAFFNPLTRQ
ncbi:MAG: hypothetical protein Q8906_08400, partial [Bacillota bacterium]|nr:hypothetical protein [Bacillota bacterium]